MKSQRFYMDVLNMPMSDFDGQGLERSRQFLARFGLTPERLAEEVPPGGDDQVVLLVGSIPAGFGTPLSDIDLLVVGPRNRSGAAVLEEGALEQIVYRLENGLEVNTAFYGPKAIGALRSSLHEALSLLDLDTVLSLLATANEPRAITLDRPTQTAADRLRTGVPLRGDPTSLRRDLLLDRLPDYVMLNERMEHFVFREDVIAELQVGAVDNALYTLSISLQHLAAVVLAVHGEASPSAKWRFRLLQRHREQIGAEDADALCGFLLGPGAGADPKMWITRAFELADRLLERSFAAKPHLAPFIMALDAYIKFETKLDWSQIQREAKAAEASHAVAT
jgi:hypothetical protein